MSTPRPRRVSIQQVADRAGVSIKTVSRVLNEERYVRPEVVKKVRAAIQKLHYTPHPSARNLASSVINTVGLVFSDLSQAPEPFGYGHRFTQLVQMGALAACQRHDFGFMLLPSAIGPGLPDDVVRRVRARRVGGVVVVTPLTGVPELLDALEHGSIAYSCINPEDLERAAPYVSVDDRAAARAMTKYLIAQGHERIGFITGFEIVRATPERLAGYREAMKEAGLSVARSWIAQGDFGFRSGRQAGEKLLALSPRPTAIFASNDDMAIGVMHAAHGMRVRVPDELSIVGFDDTEAASLAVPPLTTIRQPLQSMSEAAVEQVIAQLRPNRQGVSARASHDLFECTLIVRGSVAPPGDH